MLALPVEYTPIRARTDFVKLGETIDHACLICDGIVARFEQTRSGTRQVTALHLPGDMADLHSVVLPKTSWALAAMSDVVLGRVPHRELVALSDRFPSLARAFWRDCSVDGAILGVWSVSLGRRAGIARLAHLLCEMRCRYGALGMVVDETFDFDLTQMQLADVLGLTAVHVNRMARELRERGVATIRNKGVTIDDWDGLRAVADFDDAYLHLDHEAAGSVGDVIR